MTPWFFAAVLGWTMVLASLAWLALLGLRIMRIRERARAMTSHGTLIAVARFPEAVAPLRSVGPQLDETAENLRLLAEHVGRIGVALARARLMYGELIGALGRVFDLVRR